MKIVNCIQGSPEWFKARLGIPTSSNFDKLLQVSGKPSKQRTKYLYRLAGETITGIAEESYQSDAMLRGKEVEAEARELYQLINGVEVQEVGFCLANGYGASPDGLVGEDGLVEIKSPLIYSHVSYLIKGGLVEDYFQQLQGQLLVTGRKWVDIMSYYPALKPLVIRVARDESFLKALRVEIEVFCAELKEVVKTIRSNDGKSITDHS